MMIYFEKKYSPMFFLIEKPAPDSNLQEKVRREKKKKRWKGKKEGGRNMWNKKRTKKKTENRRKKRNFLSTNFYFSFLSFSSFSSFLLVRFQVQKNKLSPFGFSFFLWFLFFSSDLFFSVSIPEMTLRQEWKSLNFRNSFATEIKYSSIWLLFWRSGSKTIVKQT